MDDNLKKRILGLLIIFVVLAVFLPLFLKGAGYRERTLQSNIPQPPSIPAMEDLSPKLPKLEDTRDLPSVARQQQASSQSSLPNKPNEDDVVSTLVPATKKESEKTTKPVPESAKRPVISVQDKKPQLDTQGVPVGWSLQLASFKDASNAKALKKQLTNAGYKVYSRQNADMFKVFIGPDFDRPKLEALKKQLKNDFSLDGIVVRFGTQ